MLIGWWAYGRALPGASSPVSRARKSYSYFYPSKQILLFQILPSYKGIKSNKENYKLDFLIYSVV